MIKIVDINNVNGLDFNQSELRNEEALTKNLKLKKVFKKSNKLAHKMVFKSHFSIIK